MITTGEYFLKLNNYKIFFMTKFYLKKELQFNKIIKRININSNDNKLLEKSIKENNIKYLIVNDGYNKEEIKYFQSLGVKLIGVFDEIYKTENPKKARNWNNIRLYDVFI